MKADPRLAEIAREISQCSLCLEGTTGLPVPGEGSGSARVIFIGEAPGKTEARTGRPFIGRSGQLLRDTIRGIGLAEDDVFITSPVKYLPVAGTPTPAQIAHGWTHLEKQLDAIRPDFLVLLGSVACRAVLGRKVAVMDKHGSVIRDHGRSHFITIHPAAVIRFPKYRELMEEDFRKLRLLLTSAA